MARTAAAGRRRADRPPQRRSAVWLGGGGDARRAAPLEGRHQLPVGVVAQSREGVGPIRPQHLVDLVIVFTDLLDRTHEEPAYRLLDSPPAALKPVRDRLELAHELAAIPRLLLHLAQRGVRAGFAGGER